MDLDDIFSKISGITTGESHISKQLVDTISAELESLVESKVIKSFEIGVHDGKLDVQVLLYPTVQHIETKITVLPSGSAFSNDI